MYYYYKIENRINHNKYIGITTNPTVKKSGNIMKIFVPYPIFLSY